jgi:hypothetical protein
MVKSGDGHLRQLVFMDRGSPVVRALILLVLAGGCGAAGWELARLHQQLAARFAGGASLNPVEALIAGGSSLRTAWPGWVAAAFFGFALLRLRHGPPEPAAGLGSVDTLSTAQLRGGLRREYVAVRILLVAVLLVTAVDACRVIATAGGPGSPGQTLASLIPTYVEAAGFVAATSMLAAYAAFFANDIRRLGAL